MNRNNIERCRKLRKNQTDVERKLWSILRNRQLYSFAPRKLHSMAVLSPSKARDNVALNMQGYISGIKFRRQFPIGRFILDFYSSEYKLGIEADGGQHYEDKGKSEDGLRTRELAKYGVKIVRFSDIDILNNIDGVYEIIQGVIENKKSNSPLLSLLPRRGGNDGGK